jgi:hypothetical protein
VDHPPFPIPDVEPDDLHPALLARCFIFQPGLLVRRACYETVGPFDESLYRSQDYEMLLRLARRYDGRATDKAVFAQRIHAGARGPAMLAATADQTEDLWKRYDGMIFRAIHAGYALREYLPRSAAPPDAPLDDAAADLALIRRTVVMGRKGLWDLAADDLALFAERLAASGRSRLQPAEVTALRSTLDDWAYGREGLLSADGARFRQALSAIADPGLAGAIRQALVWPLPYILRQAFTHGQTAKVRTTASLLLMLARPVDLAGIALAKVMGRFGQAPLAKVGP